MCRRRISYTPFPTLPWGAVALIVVKAASMALRPRIPYFPDVGWICVMVPVGAERTLYFSATLGEELEVEVVLG
jgi:hypothetical protein